MSSIIIANEKTAKYIATLEVDKGNFLVKWALDNNMGIRRRGKEIKFFLNTEKQYQQLLGKITNLNIRNDIITNQNNEGELMNKQTENHKNFSVTGITDSGEVKELDVKVLSIEDVTEKKDEFEEEFILINKLPEAGVSIKAKLKSDGPSDVEKMMTMLGETTFAVSLMTKPQKSTRSDVEYFKQFMQSLTEAVIKYHE